MPLNIYPKLAARELSLLRCDASPESVRNAILQWRADARFDPVSFRGAREFTGYLHSERNAPISLAGTPLARGGLPGPLVGTALHVDEHVLPGRAEPSYAVAVMRGHAAPAESAMPHDLAERICRSCSADK